MYAAKFTPHAVEDIKALPRNIKNALRKQFEKKIQKDPLGCSETLTEPLAGFRSFHFGNYRVIYKVYEDLKVIAVVGVGEKKADHHAEIYKKLENLATTGKLADSVLRTMRFFSSE